MEKEGDEKWYSNLACSLHKMWSLFRLVTYHLVKKGFKKATFSTLSGHVLDISKLFYEKPLRNVTKKPSMEKSIPPIGGRTLWSSEKFTLKATILTFQSDSV